MIKKKLILLDLNFRFISSIILMPLIISFIFLSSINIFGYFVIFISTLAFWEWTQFIGLKKKLSKIIISILFSISLFIIQYLFQNIEKLEKKLFYILHISLIWWITAIVLVLTFPKSLKIWCKSTILKTLFGILTILPFYYSAFFLKSINYYNHNTGKTLLFYVIMLVWSTDIGSYFFGCLLGKNKLAKRLSPNKTLEGVMGGFILAFIFYFLSIFIFKILIFSKKIFFYSIIIVIISIFGDLTESMFKRELKINNSGNLIPGHGGILDRIDSLTAAIPVFTELIFI